MNNRPLTLGSLFDGSGGFPLGGLIAGVIPVWASEVEPFPIRVTTKRLPFMKHFGDVSKLNGAELPPVDIITFGSPCQDMSIAGKRSGLGGSRSSLFYEAIRIIKEMRCATNGTYPRWIVWENVPGAFSSNKGEDFRCVLEEICKVKDPAFSVPSCDRWVNAGEIVEKDFSVAWRLFDAQFWGVPQRRKRIYLVADFAERCAGKVLFESEGMSGYTSEGFRSWQRTAFDSENSTGTAGGADEGCGEDHGCGRKVTDALAVDGYNSCVSEKASTLGVNCGMSTGRNGIILNDQGGDRMDVTEDVTCTLRAEAHHPPVILDEPQAFHINQRDEGIDLHGVSGALMATRNNQMQTFIVENEPAAAGFCTEHSASARSIGYEEETSPTLRAGAVPAAIALENHPTDSRVKISREDISQTLTERMGTGGGNIPLVMNQALPSQTLKIRSGCEGGGKGALCQIEKSATLGCNNDQTVFIPYVKGTRPHSAAEAPVWKNAEVANTLNTFDVGEGRCNELAVKAYGICSKASNSMMSENPHSGFYEAQSARTLDANGGNPNCNQGGIAVVAFAQNQRDEVRDLQDRSCSLLAEPGMKQQTFVLQGSMIGRTEKNGPQGDGINSDASFTLDTADRHAVAYCMTTGEYTQVAEEHSPTLMARDYKDPPVVTEQAYGFDPQMKTEGTGFRKDIAVTLTNGTNPGHHNGIVEATEYTLSTGLSEQDAHNNRLMLESMEPFYIVRRLTPTECARLQGFPDWWCSGLGSEIPSDDEMRWWADVFETHRQVTKTSKKPKSTNQIKKWLSSPHSDSAEYKMWGNGVALPNVVFVLSGIVWASTNKNEETDCSASS